MKDFYLDLQVIIPEICTVAIHVLRILELLHHELYFHYVKVTVDTLSRKKLAMQLIPSRIRIDVKEN